MHRVMSYTRALPLSHTHTDIEQMSKRFLCSIPLQKFNRPHARMHGQTPYMKKVRFELIFSFFGDMKNWLNLSPFAVIINITIR